MPGRRGRGGTESTPRGTKKKTAKKKPPVKKAGYGREDHRHAPEERSTSRKKLSRETTGVDEDLAYGAGTRGHRVMPRRPLD